MISGNVAQGILIEDSGTNGNMIQGNYIGLNAAGTSAVGNGSGDPMNHALLFGHRYLWRRAKQPYRWHGGGRGQRDLRKCGARNDGVGE